MSLCASLTQHFADVTVGVWPLMDRAGGAYNSFQGEKYDINNTIYFTAEIVGF